MAKPGDAPEANASRRKIIQIILIVAVIAGGIWLWEEVLEDRVIPKRWGSVVEGEIYRSGQLSAALVERTLKKHRIAVIVTLCWESPDNQDEAAEIRAADKLGIEYLRFPLSGNGTGDINHYARAVAAVVEAQRAGQPVLVHCAAGAQRTGGVTAYYRLLIEKAPREDVLRELRHYGWRPERNAALVPFINENMGQLAVMLRDMGVIDEIPDPLPHL